jgi:hypothetical protein
LTIPQLTLIYLDSCYLSKLLKFVKLGIEPPKGESSRKNQGTGDVAVSWPAAPKTGEKLGGKDASGWKSH